MITTSENDYRMMKDQHPNLPLDLLRRIDTACDQFEESWRGGRSPRIEDFLGLFRADERAPLLNALQNLQQELILRYGVNSGLERKTIELLAGDFEEKRPLEEVVFQEFRPTNESSPAEKVARVTFRVIAGPHAGLEFKFEEHDTLFAGRLQKAQLRLENDPHFSRHHFRLEVNPPTCFLMDLNSRNGTFVNGERIRDRFLRDGDIVSGGRTKMVVSIDDPSALKSESPDDTLRLPFPRPSSGSIQAIDRSKVPATIDAKSTIEIAGYEVYEQIGEGDLGIVYRGQRLATREPCALKVLTPAAHADETAISAFLREATVLNQLQHPHIVRLLDMGASGRNVFLATEYVPSIAWTDLVQRFADDKRIRIACGLMTQVLGALEYAHTRSLVHRDVKPGNILITKKEDKLVAKLADFGLAKQYTTAGMSQVTRDGDVLGSLPFMSPDQFLNSREARPTCDLYSAGATLYWMLTGHEPIPMDGHPCKFKAILESPPMPIRQYNPNVPESLAQVVHRALEKAADKRFVSAAEMKQQLKTFVKK